jgi:CBS domain-containing protein
MASPAERLGLVRDWMSRQPLTVAPERPVAQVAGLMRTHAIRHVLVMDGDRLVGIVSNRDVRTPVGMEPRAAADAPVSTVMSETPVIVTAEAGLVEAARALLERRIGALPVLDDERVVGILTRSDALEALLAWAERARVVSRSRSAEEDAPSQARRIEEPRLDCRAEPGQ